MAGALAAAGVGGSVGGVERRGELTARREGGGARVAAGGAHLAVARGRAGAAPAPPLAADRAQSASAAASGKLSEGRRGDRRCLPDSASSSFRAFLSPIAQLDSRPQRVGVARLCARRERVGESLAASALAEVAVEARRRRRLAGGRRLLLRPLLGRGGLPPLRPRRRPRPCSRTFAASRDRLGSWLAPRQRVGLRPFPGSGGLLRAFFLAAADCSAAGASESPIALGSAPAT